MIQGNKYFAFKMVHFYFLLGIDGEVKGNKQIEYGIKYKIRLKFY